jgi:hypothetical protein
MRLQDVARQCAERVEGESMSKKLVLPKETQVWLDSPAVSGRPRTNIYTCDKCRGEVVTKDIDPGVTPFMISCRFKQGCKGTMTSNFYQCSQNLPYSFEFYRPETIDSFDPETIEHLRKGGLLLRPAKGVESTIPHDA